MGAEAFEFDHEVVDGADDRQRPLLDQLQESIRRLAPTELDLAAASATLNDGELFVTLPHRSQDDQFVAVSVSSKEAVVYYGVEHEHFWPDDPANGRLWPIDATDYVAAAFELLEAILVGRVELEVRDGVLMQRATSYLINDEGQRSMISRSGTFRFGRGRTAPRLVLFDFGIERPL